MNTIVQKHIHLLAMQYRDGRWKKCCIHHECDYEEEVKSNEAYEEEL